jgi:nitrous oxide reductase accessory protein NosL
MKANWRICIKEIIAAFFICLLILSGPGIAEDHSCFHCGMLRSDYQHSWVIIESGDGTQAEVCSVHCAAVDMVVNKDNLVKTITVGDYDTREQIDAYLAYWVIGGDQMGVMTERAKWAFKTKDAAESFIKRHGGKLAVFEETIRAAFEDLYEDTIAVKRKRIMMKVQKNKNRD